MWDVELESPLHAEARTATAISSQAGPRTFPSVLHLLPKLQKRQPGHRGETDADEHGERPGEVSGTVGQRNRGYRRPDRSRWPRVLHEDDRAALRRRPVRVAAPIAVPYHD